MDKEKQIEEITELLIEFDELGFAPTTTVPDADAYAINWRNKLTNALQSYRKQGKNTVEVVRCKDCERRNKSADLTDIVYCRYLKLTMPKDAFCSYGERMTKVVPTQMSGAERSKKWMNLKQGIISCKKGKTLKK